MDEIKPRLNTSNVEGEYYLLKKKNWIELNITLNTSKSRVNRLPEQYKGRELRIYVYISDLKPGSGLIDCGKYQLLNKTNWKEVRKIQGKDKGQPYYITESCFIRLPKICKDKKVKIYVKAKKTTKRLSVK